MRTVCFIEILVHCYILIIKLLNSFVYKKKKRLADGTFKTVAKDSAFNPPQEMHGRR